MSDLRSRCLTAMTEAMVDEAPALFDDYAAASLDALLGVLEGSLEEWVGAPPDSPPALLLTRLTAGDRLLQALKPTTEEDRE